MLNYIKKLVLSSALLTWLYSRVYNVYLKQKYCHKVGRDAFIGFGSIFEGNNSIGERTSFTNSKIGFASYIAHDCYFMDVKIGRFCSIGPYIKCIKGNHPSSGFVSSHPSFYSVRTEVGVSFTDTDVFSEFAKPIDPQEPYTIEIGNDVWLGANITILDGVKIGDGAIVASGAVVAKDVMPYSIVGGVPAKEIRKRFEDSEIEFLMDLKWWDKDIDWLKAHAKDFIHISDLKEAVKKA